MHIRLASVVFVVALLKIGRTCSEAAPGQSERGETWNFLVGGRQPKAIGRKSIEVEALPVFRCAMQPYGFEAESCSW